MNLIRSGVFGTLSLVQFAIAPLASAGTTQSVQVIAAGQDYDENLGSQRSVTIEYKFVDEDTTVVFSPAVGERRVAGTGISGVGMGVAIYHDWSDIVSTRSELFAANDRPVFVNREISQDLTAKIAHSTTLTLGGRWARYHGGRDVSFISLGARRYFKGGSFAYRLTRVNPDEQSAYFSHLVNVTVNDGRGSGKSQLWLSTGDSEMGRTQLADTFAGQNYGAMLKRTQPLSDQIALIAGAGVSSLDRIAGRVTATNLELGLQLGLN